jgi:hypothetical protein
MARPISHVPTAEANIKSIMEHIANAAGLVPDLAFAISGVSHPDVARRS